MTDRISTLGYSLLGLLASEPLSGYDLSSRLKRPISLFWNAHRSHIYPELARLEAAGLVTHERIEQLDRPDKKVYTITDLGRETVRRWVTETPRQEPSRDELVLKAFFLGLAEYEQAIRLFRGEERRHREQLALYEARLEFAYGERADELQSPAFGNFLALKRGVGYEREYADWCGLVAATLERQGIRP